MSAPRMPRAWVLNLDAELELADPRAAPTAAIRARAAAVRERLAATLPPGDVVLDRDPDAAARGLPGRCWCPTPRALARLARAGARLPAAPPFEVLRAANERGLAWTIATLDGARRCDDVEGAVSALARPGRWLAKRAYTFAGRGQRRVDGGALTDADRAWIAASLRQGAIYVEPRVSIARELGLHGWLARDGALARGAPTVQTIDDAGQWRGSHRLRPDALAPDARDLLGAALDRAAAALRALGYFGPFGVDALELADGRLHAPSEINARYAMGWPIGMGGWDPPDGNENAETAR